MAEIEDLELLIATRTPLILVETLETARVEEMFRRLAQRIGRPSFRWALATGLQALEPPTEIVAKCQKPVDVLQQVLRTPAAALYLLLDLQRAFDDPVVLSQLQEIAARCTAFLLTTAAGIELQTS